MNQITLRVSEKKQEIIDFAKGILGTEKANPVICHIINDWFEMRSILSDEIKKRSEDIHTILYLERRVESLLNRNIALQHQLDKIENNERGEN